MHKRVHCQFSGEESHTETSSGRGGARCFNKSNGRRCRSVLRRRRPPKKLQGFAAAARLSSRFLEHFRRRRSTPGREAGGEERIAPRARGRNRWTEFHSFCRSESYLMIFRCPIIKRVSMAAAIISKRCSLRLTNVRCTLAALTERLPCSV